ncbi:MAG: hypothetical protein J7647_28250 [Cyanobacteria bacterium SBLK]|nr:hypothetical protein [Cyanobacteria bacterium SBLK]
MDDNTQNTLEELIWAIETQADVQEFNIIVARCNSANLRQRLEKRLRSLCELKICSVELDPGITRLYGTLQSQVSQNQPQVLMVSGFEYLENLESILTGVNLIREEFPKKLPLPMVWWVNDKVMAKIKRVAPDLESWMITVEFELSDEDLIDFIQNLADDIFERFLIRGAVRALDYVNSDLGLSVVRRQELLAAREELRDRGIQLDPYLEGSLTFILTLGSQISLAESLVQYERSLQLFEDCCQLCDREAISSDSSFRAMPTDSAPESSDNEWLELTQRSSKPKQSEIVRTIFSQLHQSKIRERYGCLAYCLGVWWRNYGIQTPVYCEPAFELARDYFTQTIEIFENANRLDLVAKFINAFGDILERLQEWEELEKLGNKATQLHQEYPNAFRLARAYGLRAASALGQNDFEGAIALSGRAFSISKQTPPDALIPNLKIPNLEWVRSFNQASYLLILAKAKKALGLIREAVEHLELAKTKTSFLYEPQIYIDILHELHQTYRDRKEYLKAYYCKAEERSVQQQYGLRAFIGAGSLQPSQQLSNDFAKTIAGNGKVAREIVASGRDRDIANLVERMSRPDYKLTIIYGQSGVGKSSLIQAGLIPALKQRSIGTRDVLTIVHRVYTDWIQKLAEAIERETETDRENVLNSFTSEELKKTSAKKVSHNSHVDIAEIIYQLNQNSERNFLTILAFDRFEEFFFVHQKSRQRQSFYDFIANCLDVPYVKIIFSLQEDYLFRLLEFTRHKSLNTINNNILDKNILYYLGNFTPKEAQSTLTKLTQETHLFLEPVLIEELVEDLAGDRGEVRPIELQVIGEQIQAEKITTLAQYRDRGPKENLVRRYLEETIEDCGNEHQHMAQLVLYLLTDENNTRPLKTYNEIEKGLKSLLSAERIDLEKLNLVLKIFMESGLVFILPEISGVRYYQLVHNYLVPFIRKRHGEKLRDRLQAAEERNQKSEARLSRLLGFITLGAAAAAVMLGILSLSLQRTIDRQRQEEVNAAVSEIRALNSSSEALFSSDRVFDALLESLRSATKYRHILSHPNYSLPPVLDTHIQTEILTTLQQGIFWVREFNLLEGHGGDVWEVSFSPDGKHLASASADGTVKIWDDQGNLEETLEAHEGRIHDFDWSPTDSLLMTTGIDREIVLWERRDGKFSPLKTFTQSRGIPNTIQFAPDGQTFAVGDNRGNIALRTRTGETIRQWPAHETAIEKLRFSPDGRSFVSVDTEGDIGIWSADGTLERLFRGHLLRIDGLAFSPDSQKFATAGEDRSVKIWQRDGTLLTEIELEQASYGLAFSPDGQTLAAGNADATVKIWDLNGRLQTQLVGHHSRASTVAFSPDGQILVSGGNDRSVRLWRLQREFLQVLETDKGRVDSIRFAPDGTFLASGGEDGRVRLWGPDGTLLQVLQPLNTEIVIVRFSADSQILAVGGWDGYVYFWHRNEDGSFNAVPTRKLLVHEEPAQNLAFSPNGQILATSGDEVKLWTMEGALLQTLTAHEEAISGLHFSQDGLLLISTSWDTSSAIWEFKGDRFAFKKALWGHQGEVLDGTFSPDNQIVATAGDDNTIKLWTKEGKLLKTLGKQAHQVRRNNFSEPVHLQTAGHADAVFTVRFSPDGKILASGSHDLSTKLWKSDGTLMITLQGHSARIKSLDFHPRVPLLATADREGRVVLWDLDKVGDLDVLLERGCDWVRFYLETNARLSARDRHMCDDFYQ